jgi:hypothetical protein
MAKELKNSFLHVAIGEMVGTVVAVASVLLGRHAFRPHVAALEERLASAYARAANVERAQQLAGKTMDVLLMNLGGMANLATQFTLRRISSGAEQDPLWQDVARVAFGRLVGTTGAVAAISAAENLAEPSLRQAEQKIGWLVWQSRRLMGAVEQPEPSQIDQRLAELLASSMVQSAGAILSNAPAQTLFTKVANQARER